MDTGVGARVFVLFFTVTQNPIYGLRAGGGPDWETIFVRLVNWLCAKKAFNFDPSCYLQVQTGTAECAQE